MIAKYYLEKKDYYAVGKYTKLVIDGPNFSLAVANEVFDTREESIMGYNLQEHKIIQNESFMKLCSKGKYTHILRNTEILLMAAEASFHQGDSEDAIEYINGIKRRYNKAPINKINKEFTTVLINEWRENLGGEGSYFFALKRNGLAANKLNIENHKLLLPIPRQELLVNPNIVQNPGY